MYIQRREPLRKLKFNNAVTCRFIILVILTYYYVRGEGTLAGVGMRGTLFNGS